MLNNVWLKAAFAAFSLSGSLVACADTGATAAERVLTLPEVTRWAKTLKAHGGGASALIEETGEPNCQMVKVYDSNPEKMTFYGAWTVCGDSIKKETDDY